MTRCVCHVEPAAVPARAPAGELHVLLYGGRPVHDGTAAIGARLPARICNPWRFRTKGETIGSVGDYPGLAELARTTVSCARWKRFRMQCGHCVPCLIRRAALYAANVDDLAHYRWDDLESVMADGNRRDDLMAVARAVRRLETDDAERWVARSGPLPAGRAERSGHVEVFARGLWETGDYLRDCGPIA